MISNSPAYLTKELSLFLPHTPYMKGESDSLEWSSLPNKWATRNQIIGSNRVTTKQIASGGRALSQRLRLYDRLIAKTDILHRTDSQAAGTRHNPVHLSCLHLTKRRKEGYMATRLDNRKGTHRQDFSEDMAESTSTRNTQPIDGGGEAKPSPVQILNPWKKRSCPEDFGQSKKHDINHCFPIDLSHYGARIRRDASFQFQEARSIGMPAVSQQRNPHINPENPH